MNWFIVFLGFLFFSVLNARFRLSLWWLWGGMTVLLFYFYVQETSVFLLLFLSIFLLVSGGLIYPAIRRLWLIKPLFRIMKRGLPPISETEKIALDAGDLWWDKEAFSGIPDWQVLDQVKPYRFQEKEQMFYDNQVNTLCAMVDAYQVRQRQDLPKPVWDFIKKNKFFGLVIPEVYGGLGFSHSAHARIVTRLASRSSALGVTVMVPNSLGPGELLLKYGTEAQKKKYLPRLAGGKEIPCFALTSTVAGSDAGSIEDFGIVCKKTINGKSVLGFRLNWEKRYITLSPVATLLGLAFKAYDPDGLLPQSHPLSGKKELGITCALIPTNTLGVTIGKRHNPLGTAFMNGPNQGKDVFITMDGIIGGAEMIGQGWRMLMECLSIGRSISLPASASAGCQVSLLTSAAYAQAREQFGLPIASFEGIAEKLSECVLFAYRTKANSFLTTSALDSGIHPSIISATIKYRNTEMARQALLNTQDIHGGKAIIAGPKNYSVDGFLSFPFGITVEGANILSRSLMTFGQGAIRCHPFVYEEINALHSDQKDEELLDDFGRVLLKHMAYTAKNLMRAPMYVLGIPPAISPAANSQTKSAYRKISIACSQYACLADLALLLLRGELKRKEMISGSFADAFAAIYEATAAVRYFESLSSQDNTIHVVMSAVVKTLLSEYESSVKQVIANLPLASALKGGLLFWLCGPICRNKPLRNEEKVQLANATADIDWLRRFLAPDIYLSDNEGDPIREMLSACEANQQLRSIKSKVKAQGIRFEPCEPFPEFIAYLVKEQTITAEEGQQWISTRQQIFEALSVDAFSAESDIGRV